MNLLIIPWGIVAGLLLFPFLVQAESNNAFYALDCRGSMFISAERYHWQKADGFVIPENPGDSVHTVSDARDLFREILRNRWTENYEYFTHSLSGDEPEKALANFDWHKKIKLQAAAGGLPEYVDGCKVIPTAMRTYDGLRFLGSEGDFERMSSLDQWIQVMAMKGLDQNLLRVIYADSVKNHLTLHERIKILKQYQVSESFLFQKVPRSYRLNLDNFECKWWDSNTPKSCWVKTSWSNFPFLHGNATFWPNGYLKSGDMDIYDGRNWRGPSRILRHQDPSSPHFSEFVQCGGTVTYRENGSLLSCDSEQYPEVN